QYLDGIEFSNFAFSANHRFVAVHHKNGFLHLVDFHGTRVRKIASVPDDFKRVDLVFSPAEQFLLVLDAEKGGNNYLIETETGGIRKKIKGIVEFHAFSAQDEVFVFATDQKETGICDLQSRQPFQVLKKTKAIALAPDGRRLLARKDDKEILWDISAARPLPGFEMNIFAREEGLQFSPDSKILALWKEGSVAFWDVMGGKQLDKPIPVPGFGEAAFSPDSKLLLVKGYDKRIYDKLLVLDLQGIRWQKKIDWNPQFLINTPDSSFLVARNKSTGALATHEYEVIDLLTGATRTTIKVGVSSTAELFGNGKYLAVF